MRKISVLLILALAMGLVFSSIQQAEASGCFVRVVIHRGNHSVKVDGKSGDLGPGTYNISCRCMAPSVWIDGQLIALYPNQKVGNTYTVVVR